MSQRHELHLFALSDEVVQEEWKEALKPYCKTIMVHYMHRGKIVLRLIKGLFTKNPFQYSYHYEKSAALELKSIARSLNPDKIIFQLIRTVGYASIFKKENCVLDLMDCFSYHYLLRSKRASFPMSYFYWMEYRRIKKMESYAIDHFEKVCIISQKDQSLLPGNQAKLIVVPNGVMPGLENNSRAKTIDLLFTGNLSYPPNIEAVKFLCKEVLPLLGDLQYQLVIAGADPHRSLRSLETAKIRVMANVEHMPDLQQSARLLIAPMFLSTGVQNKILEAMAVGLPVLTSPQAAAAIGAIPHQHLFTAVAASDFASQIQSILAMPAGELEKICAQAKNLTGTHFQWENNVFLLESQL